MLKSDKNIEKKRYDDRAKLFLNSSKYNFNKIPLYIKEPNEYYFKLLERTKGCSKLLEIGAGIGENTSHLIKISNEVFSTDISPKSVEVMKNIFSEHSNFSAEVADMEKLPYKNESFDVICSAGSLSYGDNDVVMGEIFRVLKQGGSLFVIDSLNNNPIYKFNRYLHYIKGNRSKSTLTRMPTIKLIEKYFKKFGNLEVKYFGAITCFFPLLNKILPEQKLAKFSKWVDTKFKIKKSAFKFVMSVKKEIKC